MTVVVPDNFLQQFWYTIDVETRNEEETIVAMVD